MEKHNRFLRMRRSAMKRDYFAWPVWVLLAFSASLFLAGPSTGEDRETVRCPYLEKRAGCLKGPSDALDLTAEQEARIETIRAEHEAETAELREALLEKKALLEKLFRDPEASEARIGQAQEQWAAIKTELRERTFHARLQARSVLNEEQLRALPPGHGLGIGRVGHTCPYACPSQGTLCMHCPRAKRPGCGG